MKKGMKTICIILCFITVFLLGWRVMPMVWPDIKETIIYPIFPEMKPVTDQEQDLYIPESNTAFDDKIFETDSLVYYFYKDYCPYCRAIEPLMAGLPQQITLPDGTTSNVRLV